MKLLLLLSFCLLHLAKANSQDCGNKEKAMVSPKLRTGKQLPSDFFTTCVKDKNYYYLTYDSLDASCQKKYAGLFNFFSMHFGELHLVTNRKGQIYSIQFEHRFKDTQGADTLSRELPKEFRQIYKKLESLFGKVEIQERIDRLSQKVTSITQRAAFFCNEVRVFINDYRDIYKPGHRVSVEVRNQNYEMVDVLEEQIEQ
ncbi:MAG TPA: hypothetical protein VF609_16015 [Flavisolibacter sp.]